MVNKVIQRPRYMSRADDVTMGDGWWVSLTGRPDGQWGRAETTAHQVGLCSLWP